MAGKTVLLLLYHNIYDLVEQSHVSMKIYTFTLLTERYRAMYHLVHGYQSGIYPALRDNYNYID